MNGRQRIPSIGIMPTIALLLFGLILIPGCKKHGHGDQENHGEAQAYTEPHSYAEAVNVIHDQLEKIERLIDTRKLDRVHAEAAVIRDVANDVGKLAAKKDSGVPRNAIREINLAAKDLAATFDPIDEAGDSGDLKGTRKVYKEMVALFESLKKHVDPDLLGEDHDHD